MMRLFKDHLTVSFILVFLLGGMTFWGGRALWDHYHLRHASEGAVAFDGDLPNFNNIFGRDFFRRSRDPFKEMERMHREIMKNFGGSDTNEDRFGGWFQQNFGGGVPSDFQMSEDKDFIYYEIDTGEDTPKTVDVEVKEGQVTVKGELEKKEKDSTSSSLYSSTFVRSFPAPENVDAAKFQLEQKDKKIIIKFPKH